LGVMGVADVFEKLGLAYDSIHAYNFADRVFEFVSYMAIDESANLAEKRGAYKNFPGSRWSKGHVPIDSITTLEEDRGMPLVLDKTSHHRGLDWDILRARVKKGIRNATLMAVAPNANIGLLAGTVPGMDARFSQVFSRNKISGKYLDINHNLVKDLKNMDLWDEVKEKIIESQGDISQIEVIPEHIRNVYKTSFTNSPYAYVEVAARAQKWFDQAISRNIYLETRDVDETMKIYSTAWEKGLKSTYYLHMKPRHTAEQSTVRVNKAEAMGGRKGFGALVGLTSATAAPSIGFAKVAIEPVVFEPVVMRAPEPIMAAPKPEPQVVHEIKDESVLSESFEIVREESAPVETLKREPELVPVMASRPPEKPALHIHVSEDPGDALICDSCQ
jgi:ribonucleoside-diphosphate reductase alpha chain